MSRPKPKSPSHISVIVFILSAILFSGCRAFYSLGYNAGSKDYDKIKAGKSIGYWRSGYLSAIGLRSKLDSLNDQMEEISKRLERIFQDHKTQKNKIIQELNSDSIQDQEFIETYPDLKSGIRK